MLPHCSSISSVELRADRAMLKGGATKVGLPKPGLQERIRSPSSSATSTSVGMKSSRSSSTLAADLRISKLKRASSDDALAKPGLGTSHTVSRMKKTVTTGAIYELADNRPRSLSGLTPGKKSGIPSPREIPSTITRDRISLRDQLRTGSGKKMVSSASTSSLSMLAKNSRSSIKTKADESNDRVILECQVKELLAEAKAKEFEISKLRSELQRYKNLEQPNAETPDGSEAKQEELVRTLREKNGKFQRELAALREENQSLKEKLLPLECSPNSPGKYPLNGVLSDASMNAPKISPSSCSDFTKGSPSPISSDFEKIPSRSESVERLTERIQKMEESHHSTAEELQATLQELADQQQVVQELTAENERLAEEKGLLQSSLQQQRERVELLVQKNEALLARLQEPEARATELEQKYAELVESSCFEREKLVDIQQQLSGSLRALEKEHQEAQGVVRSMREEKDALNGRLEQESETIARMVRELEEQRDSMEALRVENGKLRAQMDMERQKVVELKAVQNASDSTELQELLKVSHSEKDWLEVACNELRQELLQATTERERIQAMLNKAQEENQQLQEQRTQQEQVLRSSMHCLEESSSEKEAQIKDLKETIFELEDQVEQQRAVGLHNNQRILDLESQGKKLEEQKIDLEKQLKAMSKQMKDETEEWRRFQADLQTAVVVANDIKIEAQQELRNLRRRLQEEQDHNAKLEAELETLQGNRCENSSSCCVTHRISQCTPSAPPEAPEIRL